MDETTKHTLENLHSPDKAVQNEAYFTTMEMTEQPVDWAYEIWDDMVAALTHKDNHERAIASQVLCNLAISDPENRIMNDFTTLLNVTRDKRFVTARHCLQALWKIGLAGPAQRAMLLQGLSQRYTECASEKNCTLIRFDIIQGLKNLYDHVQDEAVKHKALALIEAEDDPKYQKKYAKVWR